MNTIAYILAAVLLGLVVLAKIPGLEHMVRPVIDLAFTGLKAFLEHSISWGIWAFKMLLGAHTELIRHLVLSPSQIDPTHDVREKANNP